MTDMQSTGKHELMDAAKETRGTSLSSTRGQRWFEAASAALTQHWPEYLMEAACLGLFMISACSFVIVLEHPSSIARHAIANSFVRRMLIGIAMGLTAIVLIYSPWGKQSGAHFNPSTTLTSFRLGKIEPWDAILYVLAQFVGGTAGVMLSAVIWGEAITHENVRYAATLPGSRGTAVAFVAEIVISFLLMTVVLNASNSARMARFTGILAGALVATYIGLESPLSGMSMNPARTFASAFSGRIWNALWIYFTAPPIGMLLAAEVYLRVRGKHAVFCAKLHHANDKRCIFRCNYKAMSEQQLTLKETM